MCLSDLNRSTRSGDLKHHARVLIRDGTVADIPAAVSIHFRSYTASDTIQHVSADGTEDERRAHQPELMSRYFNEISSLATSDSWASFRVAEVETRVVAFICTKS